MDWDRLWWAKECRIRAGENESKQTEDHRVHSTNCMRDAHATQKLSICILCFMVKDERGLSFLFSFNLYCHLASLPSFVFFLPFCQHFLLPSHLRCVCWLEFRWNHECALMEYATLVCFAQQNLLCHPIRSELAYVIARNEVSYIFHMGFACIRGKLDTQMWEQERAERWDFVWRVSHILYAIAFIHQQR